MEDKKKGFDLSSAVLHIIAMACMLLDHTWATLLPQAEWMTCIGRIAFPIFAFLLAEGYRHTHNLKKYMLRLFLFALLSELPFNLMCEGMLIYPFHQNVLWTFLLALSGIWATEAVRKKGKHWLTVLLGLLITALCTALGYFLMVDYFGAGVLMVFLFYFFHGKRWWNYLLQFLGMYWINMHLLGGYYYQVSLFGYELEFFRQGIAILALPLLWLYRGRQGHHSKPFQYFCYAFYPAHILLLVILSMLRAG